MILLNISVFIGKFHPLLVHLPIGFLVLAALLQWLGFFEKYTKLRSAVSVSLLLGCISALFSCITGYLLSLEGGYNVNTLEQHMWMGIITTIAALITWLMSIKIVPVAFFNSSRLLSISMIFILLFITIAGHWGGTLTHGEGYLALNSGTGENRREPITDINQALVFGDLIEPILQHKCGDCHNSNKMKGELSLQSFAQIMKGGKHGVVVVPGKPGESELIKRILLDPADKKFMPTDGKPPLTRDETALITWWVENGLQKEDKTVTAAAPPDSIKKIIENYFGAGTTPLAATGSHEKKSTAISLTAPALKADAVQQLTQAGFVVKQIHFNPDLLDITLPASDSIGRKDKLAILSQVKDNIAWLNISGSQIQDDDLAALKEYSNLQRLRLDKNPVTDKGVQQLATLKNLQSVNLCFTQITPAAIGTLSAIPGLHTAYIWGTAIPQKDTVARKDSSLHIIAGNNSVK